MSDLR